MTCGITVAPMIPVASRMLSVPAKPGTKRCLATSPPSGLASKSSKTKEATTTPTSAVIPASSRRKPICCRARMREGAGAGDEPGGEERDAEEEVEAERGADHLGDVGSHRDDLGLQPEPDRGAAREALAAELGEVLAGRDAELGRLGLDHHRDQVGREDDPEQQVAELGAAGDVGGEVAGVDVGDGGDEGRAEEGPDPGEAARLAVERAPRRAGDGGLAGKDRLDRRRMLVGRRRVGGRRLHRPGSSGGRVRSGPGIGVPCGSWLGSPSLAAISCSSSSEM